MGWRTVDLLTCAFLGVAFGVAYWAWCLLYNGSVGDPVRASALLGGLFGGTWFMAGVVGGLVVRRPGAALFAEVLAAFVSMPSGTEWGATVSCPGIVQGLGAELVFALFAYRSFGLAAAVLAGAMAGPFGAAYESTTWIQDWSLGYKVAYLVVLTASPARCWRAAAGC